MRVHGRGALYIRVNIKKEKHQNSATTEYCDSPQTRERINKVGGGGGSSNFALVTV